VIETAAAVPSPSAPAEPWGAVALQRDAWPSPAQELLLSATLMPDERALHAWAQVRAQIDIAGLDGATLALLPALRKNLLALGVDDELLSLFKGVHRYSWARNQMLLAPMIPMVQALERAGIATLLLKGAAFVADTRLDAGMRPMNDIDVLVPTGQTRAAIDVLVEMGLAPVGEVPAWYVAEYAPRFVPSHGFRDELDRQLDLHWHVLHASCQPEADDDFWAAAESIELLGVRTRALCPSDELLLVILHGLRWNAIPTYRWVVDAALLCAGAIGPIDYDRLVEQARKRRVTVTLAAGLDYLRRVADSPVPPRIVRALGSRRPLMFERAELRAQMTQPRLRSRVQWAILYHQQHLRRELALASRPTLVRHLRLARRRLGIERVRDLLQVFSGGPPGPSRPPSEMAAAVGRGVGETSSRPIVLGEPLDCGEAEFPRERVAYGAWRAQADGCWLAGRQARLALALPAPVSGSLVLELSADGLLAGGRSRQRLGVSVNGRSVTELAIDRSANLRQEPVILPREAVAGHGSLDLVLDTPDAVSPAQLGLDDDDRRVGVFLRRLRVRAPTVYELGSALALGEGSDDESVLFGDWGAAEPLGRWTVGPRATLLMRLQGAVPALELEFDAIPFLGPWGHKIEAEVRLNGQRVTSVSYRGSAPEPSVTRVPLAAAVVGAHGDILLEWRIGDPRSPHSLGISEDRRDLGLFVRRVALHQRPGAPAGG
jgi:Uncharacterised nucleotidyltransferase